ncbi:Protein N-acetyltransferase, RimJ/RimL family [Pseudomonas flavescens]|uniref:Protein N-acetyltransferase, RimJ/RimL family n=1 Tax=Phytopseudomonas flavescens TaxID=29435 RepID=A0A1G8ICP4_9GAMM|nr:GNAT family N-acetyltransferase [Pseudomonas flavescens]SDI16551.1 Protein N-acetyltransferase, RimJ/RimL family [Pseudomonas flavescens]
MNAHTPLPVLTSLYPDRQLRAHCTDQRIGVSLNDVSHLELLLEPASGRSLSGTLDHLSGDEALQKHVILAACEAAFVHWPALDQLRLAVAPPHAAIDSLVAEGLFQRVAVDTVVCSAHALWQQPLPWLNKGNAAAYPQHFVQSGCARHPRRPAVLPGTLYSRFIPWLGQTLTLELADPQRDLSAFNRWMNDPRVARFWEEQGSLEAHGAYLQKQLDAPHTLPVIGRFDGQAFGYFEVYWAKEDRIAPFYEAHDYDRGLHLLVGEEAFRGKRFYTAWFSSICHYLFLDDPRTQRIVCEPRHDNQRQIANFDRSGFAKVKHFDFPHKRALLVMLSRERFFFDRLYTPLDVVQSSHEGTIA